uniref:Putative electron transport protein SCO1/SenC n=1 Tax=uncultured prokaryote AT3 TaxID=672202 RepID=D3W8F2_9ZZZZ|nr:putative electron transport protein SCO1/SenC [uncultured prokaryote AT3]
MLALCLVSGIAIGVEKVVPAFHGQDVTGADYGRDFRLQDASGQWRTPKDYRGKLVLMFFGFTQCPDVCPTELQSMARLMDALGKDAARIQVLFVTLDPARDTAAMIQSYVSAFNPGFVGLRGDEAATATVAKEFKVYYRKVPGSAPGRYSLDHSAFIYVLDGNGVLRLRITPDLGIEAMKSDLLRLLVAAK